MHEWDESQIMTILQEQGILNNKYMLRHSEILVCCPFHADKNPSMSISLTKGGIVHCFAGCFDGTFTQFVYKLLGGYGKQAVEYIRRFQKGEEFMFEKLPRKEHAKIVKIPTWDDLEISEEELAQYDYTDWTYSVGRGIREEVCKKFRLGINYQRAAITFPLKVNSKYIAVCERKINEKKFYIPPKLEGRKPVAYLDEAIELSEKNDISKIVIVESIYNALTCFTYGIPAIATLGSPTEIQAEILKKSKIREFLIACDGDNAGTVFASKWMKWFRDKKITTEISLPKGKDVNDLVTDDPTGQYFSEIVGRVYWDSETKL